MRCKSTTFPWDTQIFFVLLWAKLVFHMKLNKKLFKKVLSKVIYIFNIPMTILGVLIFCVYTIFQINNNILLFSGLFFVFAGIAGYIYHHKKSCLYYKHWLFLLRNNKFITFTMNIDNFNLVIILKMFT